MIAPRKLSKVALASAVRVNYVPRPRRFKPTLATQKPAAKKSKTK